MEQSDKLHQEAGPALHAPIPTRLASSGLPFFSAPTIWATNMGFSEDPVIQWFHYREEPPALLSETENPILGFPLDAVSRPAWARSLRFRQALLTRLLHLAKKAIHFKVRKTSVDRLAQRRSALRNNDISIWSRLIKPVGKIPAGFATSWFTTPEGVRRICRNETEAREGARQEWALLMVEGSPKWNFPLVSQRTDEWGRPRGSLNLAVACLALPGDPIRSLSAAYMGPSGSGFSILYW